MPEAFPTYILDGLGTVGLCVLFVFSLAKGWVVTRRELEQAHHETNEWRAESRIKDQHIAEQDEQIKLLSEVGHTVEQLFSELQAKKERREGR